MRWLLLLLFLFPSFFGHAQVYDPYERASNSLLELKGYTYDKYDWNKGIWWRPDSTGIQFENGWVVAVISFRYYPSWKGYDPRWRNFYRYNTEGKLKSITYSIIENQAWLPRDSMYYAYDNQGRLEEEVYFKGSPREKTVHHYDTNNNDTSTVTWRTDTKSLQWYPKSKEIRDYSANNLLLRETQFIHKDTGWHSFDQKVYTYVDTLLVDRKDYYKPNGGPPWMLKKRMLYTYDTLDQLVWVFTYGLDSYDQFGPDQKIHYTYTNGRISSSALYMYDAIFAKWEFSYIDTTMYAGDSIVTKKRYFIKPTSMNNDPLDIWRYKYLPEGDLSIQEHSYYNWILKKYVPDYIYKFYYGDTLKTLEPPINEPPSDPNSKVLIYPNPFIGDLFIHLPNGNKTGTFTLYSINGEAVIQENLYHSKSSISIQKQYLSTGVYLYQLVSGGQVYVGKLFVPGH